MSKKKDLCKNCSCMNEYGYCTMPHYDKWYACPIESEKEENKKEIQKYIEWISEKEREREGKNANKSMLHNRN